MSTYSFKITKGVYELSLSTTDRDFVVEQFAMWVKKASEYTQHKRARECKEIVNAQICEEEKITKQNIEKQLEKFPKTEPVIDNDIKNDDKTKELDVIYSQQEQKEETIISNINNNNPEFDSILDQSMHTPQEELSFKPNPSIKKDNAFLNYIGGRKVNRNIEYLLLTAYYFTQYEQKPRFTLKQINAKLMQNLAVIIDHSVLQEAISRDYIECLPDLTGVIGASEYRLTAYGEKTLLES